MTASPLPPVSAAESVTVWPVVRQPLSPSAASAGSEPSLVAGAVPSMRTVTLCASSALPAASVLK